MAALAACTSEEAIGTSASPLTSTVTFDSPAPPGPPDGALGVFGGIDFGGAWLWSAPFRANSTNHCYFSADVPRRSFSFAVGPRRLDAVTVYGMEPGTLTLTDDRGQSISASIGTSLETIETRWSQASSTVMVEFSQGWLFGLDDLRFTELGRADAGAADAGRRDAGFDAGPPASGRGGSLVFHVNETEDDYARLVTLPDQFGTAEFTLEMWVRPNHELPTGLAGGSSRRNWSETDPPEEGYDWWYEGNFLLDGHRNSSSTEAGTFDLQLYGEGRVRWLFHDGTRLYGVQARPAESVPWLLDGAWHHIAAVRRFTGTSGADLELWVDGVRVGFERTTSRRNMRTYWNGWPGFPQIGWVFGAEKISASGGTYWDDYKGHVTDVRFWRIARPASTLASAWRAPITGTETGLAGWFRVREGRGDTTCDSLAPSRCMELVARENPIWSTAAP
jgi:hypothetical protein